MTAVKTTTATKAIKPAKSKFWMPSYGLVVGGEFDGHRYVFHGFIAEATGLMVDASLTRPNWPFPRRMLLAPGQYSELHAVPGDRAKRLPADGLIAEAYAKLHASQESASPERTRQLATTEQDEHALALVG